MDPPSGQPPEGQHRWLCPRRPSALLLPRHRPPGRYINLPNLQHYCALNNTQGSERIACVSYRITVNTIYFLIKCAWCYCTQIISKYNIIFLLFPQYFYKILEYTINIFYNISLKNNIIKNIMFITLYLYPLPLYYIFVLLYLY